MKKILMIFCVMSLIGCVNHESSYYANDVVVEEPAPMEIVVPIDEVYVPSDDEMIYEWTQQEMEEKNARWGTSRKDTRWQEYKGTMVRVQILLGNSNIREMRLRLMQNADGMDIDGDIRHILSRVADYEMKRICGRNTVSIAIVYDEPSFDVMRPTPYFDFKIEAEGATMREYGFRCEY